MKNNKALMCLLTASISALAAAPALAKDTNKEDKVIDMGGFFDEANLSSEQILQKKELVSQVDVLLSRKSPQMKIGESINIMVDSYGRGQASIKSSIYERMGLGAGNVQDSTNLPNINPNAPGASGQCNDATGLCPVVCHIVLCHSACHSACHGACHGARGWR